MQHSFRLMACLALSLLMLMTPARGGAAEVEPDYLAKFEQQWPRKGEAATLEQYASPERFDAIMMTPDGPLSEAALAKLDNTKAALAWGDAYRMMALNEMFRATGEEKYLEAMDRYAQAVLAARDDRRGVALWTGEVAPVWGCSQYAKRGRAAFAVHTGIIAYPVLDFLLNAERHAYREKMGARFETLLAAMQESLDFHARQWRDGPAPGEGYYVFLNQEEAFEGQPLPINRLSAMGVALWYSWKLSANEDHRDKALAMGRYFKNRLSVGDDDAYYWGYWLPEHKPLPVGELGGGEDVSHGALSVALPLVLHADGQVFDAEEMKRFARTVTRGFGRSGDGVFYGDVIGKPGSAPSHVNGTRLWLPLSSFDPDIFNRISTFFLTYQPNPDPLTIAMLLRYKPVGSPADAAKGKPLLRVETTLDLGRDLGQGLGTLFEARDADGELAFGAGFANVFNTRFRNDRWTLQFFLRPAEGRERFKLERLPRPSELDGGVYMFDLEGRVYAWSRNKDSKVRYWDEASRSWIEEPDFEGARLGSHDGMMRVRGKWLRSLEGRVEYDGAVILPPAEQGSNSGFYYANGHLIFYQRDDGNQSDNYTKIYACPWNAYDGGVVDLERAHVMKVKYPREFPYASGQLGDEIITTTNMGGVYRFDGRGWEMIVEPDDKTSYQVYTAVNYRDRLLLGQYPTGFFLAYDGSGAPQVLEDWPPVMEGVSSSARELQTSHIYRGELMAGVWPWSELWRMDPDDGRWHFISRMFTRPETTLEFTHPWERELVAFSRETGTDIVMNLWGQRLTSLSPLGNALIIGTSAKGTNERDPRLEWLTDEVWEEYGQVLRLEMPTNLAATVAWSETPTRLVFEVTDDAVIITQDGRELARTPFDPRDLPRLPAGEIEWGRGAFGDFSGRIVAREFSY